MNTNFDNLYTHITENDQHGDASFFAKFSEVTTDSIELSVTDSYHQGVSIELKPDGTWTAVFIGG